MSTQDDWVTVDLDQAALDEADAKAEERLATPRRPSRRVYNEEQREDYETARRKFEVDGARAERAVVEWTGLPWTDVVSGPDVGVDLQVRSTRHRTGHLPLKRSAPVGWRYVLVIVGERGRFYVAGWLCGRCCKRVGVLRDDRLVEEGVYWVDQADLRPPRELIRPNTGPKRWGAICAGCGEAVAAGAWGDHRCPTPAT